MVASVHSILEADVFRATISGFVCTFVLSLHETSKSDAACGRAVPGSGASG